MKIDKNIKCNKPYKKISLYPESLLLCTHQLEIKHEII